MDQLEPDWEQQVYRITCPCQDAQCGYEWARYSPAFTLGELFLALGKEYTAAQIYSFYRTLRLVAVKRRKGHGKSAPASGSVSGVTNSESQAARIRLEHTPNKEHPLAEYVAANELGHLAATKENVDAAIRYLYKLLLRDLRPPWLTDTFPQALPGGGTLSRYTIPCFLLSEASDAATIFRDEAVPMLRKVATDVSLEVVRVLGRPL